MASRLTEIAQRAGVSVSTVSRVLNEKPGVNQYTRRQVLTALDVLGYDRPSRLQERTAGLVGLIVPELENPYFPRFAQLVETYLAPYGFAPVLCGQSAGGVHEDEYVQMLLEHAVSGIVFVSGVHAIAGAEPGRYVRLHELGMPFVTVNGFLPGVPGPSLSTDDVVAVELAVNHLHQMGHERIGMALGEERYTPVQLKAEGYRRVMRRLHPELGPEAVEDAIVMTSFTVQGGVAAAERLLAAGVTGVVCASDVMALGVIRGVRQAGLRVPEDVSVVGSDDSMLIEFTDPPLTTVRQPTPVLAQAAVQALVDQISGKPARAENLLFAPELVVRGSTARVAPG